MTPAAPTLRFGPADALVRVLIVPPLFDEANRMRRTLALTMRALAKRGMASALPDLPGQGDSLLPNEEATLERWQEALADIARAEEPTIVASWRGGALIDDAAIGARGWWRMAPVAGASLVRALVRTRIAGDREAGQAITADELRNAARDGWVELGGYRLTGVLLDGLEAATPAAVTPLREVTPAEMAGSALWLRSEPGENAAMAEAMAADIAAWADNLLTRHSIDTRREESGDHRVVATSVASRPPPQPARDGRHPLTFEVEGVRCMATLDPAPGTSGLLIVSGGNEIRCGAHRGMAELAAATAGAGWPVLRYDRRGVGDSEGVNGGFLSSAPDIAAAVSALREACPQLRRIVAFGNCDAAAALALFGRSAGIDTLLLGNPWTLDDDEGAERAEREDAAPLPSAADIRARYMAKLRQPSEWWRLMRGGVDLRKLARGLARAGRVETPPAALAGRLAEALAAARNVQVLLAGRDRVARAFERNVATRGLTVKRIDSGSHSFADERAREWLRAQISAALSGDG